MFLTYVHSVLERYFTHFYVCRLIALVKGFNIDIKNACTAHYKKY